MVFVVETRDAAVKKNQEWRWRPIAKFSTREQAENCVRPLLNPAWPDCVRIVEKAEGLSDDAD